MFSSHDSVQCPAEIGDVSRYGKFAVITAIVLVPLLGFAALAVDATYLMEVKKEAQIAAESAALAGVFGLTHPDRMLAPPDMTQPIAQARANAIRFAGLHNVGEVANIVVDANNSNAFTGDLYIGRLRTWGYQNYPWDDSDPTKYNSVRVRARRTAGQNGPVALFFANVFGIDSAPLEAVATARLEIGVVIGFDPGAGEGSGLMPFAVCVDEWDEKIHEIDPDPDDGVPPQLGPDEYAWVTTDGAGNEIATPYVAPGADGIPEVMMFPQNHGGGGGELEIQGCGAGDSGGGVEPGNFGTVDIGHDGNSTADLIRQILEGVSAEDFAYLENEGIDLTLSEQNEEFDLNGDTGISAGIKSALESIIGECRTVLLYTYVEDPGNNAQFTIVRYQPIRILEVNLTGNPKYIRIQPAICQDGTAIIDPDAGGSNIVFHPPRLIE